MKSAWERFSGIAVHQRTPRADSCGHELHHNEFNGEREQQGFPWSNASDQLLATFS
jgi:hypothetical protein